MSRAYRLRVRESIRRVIRGSDRISTQLELLDILPRPAMAARLAAELAARGFIEEDGKLVRRQAGITISIDAATGEVEVRSEVVRDVEVSGDKQGSADEDRGQLHRRQVEQKLREQLRAELEGQADAKSDALRQEATHALESALRDLQGELDGVVNRVTAAALKEKAAQLGEIRQLTEDVEAGSMTIVLEV